MRLIAQADSISAMRPPLPVPELGLALRMQDELAFRDAVSGILSDKRQIQAAVNGLRTGFEKAKRSKLPRRCMDLVNSLDVLECKIACLQFQEPPGLGSPWFGMTSWLSQTLSGSWPMEADIKHEVLLRCIAKWHFWLMVLHCEERIIRFCSLAYQSHAEPALLRQEVRDLLVAARLPLSELFAILHLDPHSSLRLSFSLPDGAANDRRPQGPRTNLPPSAPGLRVVSSSGTDGIPRVEQRQVSYDCEIDIRMSHHGEEVSVVLDTGAQVSWMDRDTLMRLAPETTLHRFEGQYFMAVVGRRRRVEAYAMLDIFVPATVHGRNVLVKIPGRINVISSAGFAMLFGMDLIMQHHIRIDPAAQTVIIGRAECASAPVRCRAVLCAYNSRRTNTNGEGDRRALRELEEVEREITRLKERLLQSLQRSLLD